MMIGSANSTSEDFKEARLAEKRKIKGEREETKRGKRKVERDQEMRCGPVLALALDPYDR